MFSFVLVKQMIFKSASCAAANKTDAVLFNKEDLDYYTTDMNLPSAAKAVREAGATIRWAIGEDKMCSVKTEELKDKAQKYLESGQLCGRAAIKSCVKQLIHRKGVHVLVTGGRSTGKSLLFSSILSEEQAYPGKPSLNVVRVDARANSDMLKAINLAVCTPLRQGPHNFLSRTPNVTVRACPQVEVGGLVDTITPTKTPAEAMEKLANTLEGGVSHNVLLIDEANMYLPVLSDKISAQNTPTNFRDFYGSVVLWTKQLMMMSVFWIASTQNFCNRLEDLGCRPKHITDILVMAEPSPKETVDWLESMGVGENLRGVLVNLFGGNVYEICQFLIRLPDNVKEDRVCLRSAGANAVLAAIYSWIEAGGSYKEIRMVLQEVARTGFCPIEKVPDPMARLLTHTNVCTTLTEDATEFHVPPTLRRGRSGLTPESQLMRVLIAYKLEALDEKYLHGLKK